MRIVTRVLLASYYRGHCLTLTLHRPDEAAQDVEDLVDVHQVLGFQPRPTDGYNEQS